ncbi:MAG: efflux RND transporter periplasmic adaptor subunit [Calditrichaceae bacterium]|nr:efflux RND transporter periplasmic adaptor subunit [Calditrichaceae bacterium]
MKLTKKKKILYMGLPLIVVIVILVMVSMSGNSEEAVSVTTAKVDKQRVVETVTATGRIQPKTQVKISADVAAKITRLEVKEGDWVEKGEFLVQLDRERYLAAVQSAEANMRAVEANAHLVRENMLKAEKDFNRTKELYNQKLESQAGMDQMYAAYQVEKARYQSALENVAQSKAVLKQAQDDLSKTTIYAPMAGTISQLNKEVGEIALGSQFQEDVIMVISNLSGMEALVDVDENDIVSIQLGDSATIEVDALPDMVFRGTVSEMANSAKISASGTTDQKTEFEVKIAIDDPGNSLRPGMTASSDIVTEIRDSALAVPIQCVAVRTPDQLQGVPAEADSSEKITYTPDKDGFVQIVFVVHDSKVKAVQVESGIQSGTHIEVLNGLDVGDEIVTGNYRAISQFLNNGTEVKVENTGGGAETPPPGLAIN